MDTEDEKTRERCCGSAFFLFRMDDNCFGMSPKDVLKMKRLRITHMNQAVGKRGISCCRLVNAIMNLKRSHVRESSRTLQRNFHT